VDVADLVSAERHNTMNAPSFRALRVVSLALCGVGLAAILIHGREVARRNMEARAAAQVEGLLFRELEVEARRLGAAPTDPDTQPVLRARAHYEAGLFARALADGMAYLDPVIEARLLELLRADLGVARPTSTTLLARARELDLLANDPVIRRRLINKRMLWEG
jgi:hypothetical protein